MTENSTNHDHRFCVFQCRSETLALAATHVRSVSPQPEVTTVPFNDSAMLGIAYLQKEFVPVYELIRLMGSQDRQPNDGRQLLLLSLDDGDFGLLVDQVLGLEPLEISYTGLQNGTGENGQRDWSSIVTGAATYHDQFVSVVDPAALAQMLGTRLTDRWQDFEQMISSETERSAGVSTAG